jgi:hypothetical protein
MKDLLILHQAIKDSAVDCKVLKDFHEKTGIQVNCSENQGVFGIYKKIVKRVQSKINFP